MKMTKHVLIAAIAAVTSSAFADQHKADVFVHGGYVSFSGEPSGIDIDETGIFGVSAGFPLNESWTLEPSIAGFETEVNDVVDLDAMQYRLDTLYQIGTFSSWKPFLSFGLSHQDVDILNTSDKETLLNLGAGVKRDLGDNWQLRTDLRNYNSLDDEYNELALTFGVGYRFGAAAAPVAAPAPEPVKEIDSDGDGVFDSKDQCADTPKTHKVDAVGCSLKLTETVEIELNITFDSAKAVIKPEFEGEVAKLAEFMSQYADTVVTVEGHTDSQGADAYNQKLSQSRADAVKAMLSSKYGVSADRVKAVGYGEAKPIADNASANGREQNRRVVGEVSSTVTKMETK